MNRSMTNNAHAHNVQVDVFSAQMRALSRHERAAVSQAIERHDVAELERASIARRIKQARQETGLSQPEMADALGVIPRTYQNYESVKDPRTPWGSMNDIAKITGKSTEWLIHGDKATPDLLGSVGEVDGHIDQMAVEFRGYVGELKAMLVAAAEEREDIRRLLDTQEEILKEMQRVAGAFPNPDSIDNLTAMMQDLADRAEAEAAGHAEDASTQDETRRRAAEGP